MHRGGVGPTDGRAPHKERLQERLRRERRVTMLVNVRSRRGAAHHEAVRRRIVERGWAVDAVHLVRDAGRELPELLPRIVADRPGLLVVGSGDGTLASTVGYLAGTDIVLGYLPLGTTNNFGRGLGLPLSPDAAVDVVTGGKVADVDLGLVNGTYFTNLVSVGISSAVAGRTPHVLKRRIGRAAYALTGAHALLRHQPFTAEVTGGTTTWRIRTHQLNIANGRMHAGTPIAADASLDDRLLVAYALGGPSRLSTVGATARQALTAHRPMDLKGYLLGTRFTLTTDRPIDLDVDGELRGTTPATVEIAAQALHVLVPTSFVDT